MTKEKIHRVSMKDVVFKADKKNSPVRVLKSIAFYFKYDFK